MAVDQYQKNCHKCVQSSHPHDKTPGWLHSLAIEDRPWDNISMDFHSLNMDKHGYNYVMVVVDRLGKRSFCLPCKDIINAKQAAQLYYRYIWRIYRCSRTITSDRGPQFVLYFIQELTTILRIKQKLSTAYHPQIDGQTEIMNQILDQRLRPFVNHYQDNWSELLPMLDFANANLPQESTGVSPYMLEMGYEAQMQFDWTERTLPDNATPTEKINRQEA